VSGRLVVAVLGLSVLILILIGVLVWGVRTSRELWRRGTTPWGRFVYDYGVRRFGVGNAVVWTLLAGYFGATRLANGPEDALRCAIGAALLTALFCTPVALGLGYVWGTWMAWYTGLPPDSKPTTKSLAPNNRWRGP
jgi:hypothetical protein